MEKLVRLVKDCVSQKKEAERLEFETQQDFRNFRFWRVNVKSEVWSGASRPTEAMIWIIKIESAKSIAELKTSNTIIGTKLQKFWRFVTPKKRVASRKS